MSRTHAEIQRLTDRIGNHLALAQSAGAIQPDQIDDLRACLYGLYALLRLHFLQEEENYFTLADPERPHRRRRRTQLIPGVAVLKVFVVHGEPQPADTLRTRLDREFGWQSTVPRPNQLFIL